MHIKSAQKIQAPSLAFGKAGCIIIQGLLVPFPMVINWIGKTKLEQIIRVSSANTNRYNTNNAKYAEPQVRKKPFCDL